MRHQVVKVLDLGLAISRPRNSESFADSIPPCFSGGFWQVLGRIVCAEGAHWRQGVQRTLIGAEGQVRVRGQSSMHLSLKQVPSNGHRAALSSTSR